MACAVGVVTAVSARELAPELAARLPDRVERDVPASTLTSYRLGGPISVLVRVADEDQLAAVASVIRGQRPPVLVIGRGSNLLVADAGFPGLGIVLEATFEALAIDERTVTGGAALAQPVLARRTAAAGRSGLEFYVGIPGSVGGAVRMNAGGHGRETRDVLVDARVADLASGEIETRAVDDLDLGYRSSGLGPMEIVLAARFRVTPDEPQRCEERIAEIVRWRREHQPGGSNAGSVFANPPGDSAGRLIDVCGLKGLRVGAASVSTKHANFFQAEPGARADDVRELIEQVQRRVAARTGVVLQPELRLVGFSS